MHNLKPLIQSEYSASAGGRRRLRDWEKMPGMMCYLFYAVDARVARDTWVLLRLCACGIAVLAAMVIGGQNMGEFAEYSRAAMYMLIAGATGKLYASEPKTSGSWRTVRGGMPCRGPGACSGQPSADR